MSATILVESPHRSHLRNRVLAAAAALAIVAGGTAVAMAATDGSSAKPTAPPVVAHEFNPHDIGRGATTPGALDAQLTVHNGRR
jgi:hypothetical protein